MPNKIQSDQQSSDKMTENFRIKNVCSMQADYTMQSIIPSLLEMFYKWYRNVEIFYNDYIRLWKYYSFISIYEKLPPPNFLKTRCKPCFKDFCLHSAQIINLIREIFLSISCLYYILIFLSIRQEKFGDWGGGIFMDKILEFSQNWWLFRNQ